MKKKIISLCMVLCLGATAVIGGTLAYFSDTDEQKNTFTVGNVDIEIDEVFDQDAELMPGEWNKNNVQKEVYIKNTGDNAAYMWAEILIPAELDTPGKASENDLHFNYFDTYLDAGGSPVVCKAKVAEENGWGNPYYVINEVNMGTVEIDNVTYNRYLHYTADDTAKVSGEKTAALLAQVYMDRDVEQCTTEGDADGCLVLKDGTHYTGSWELIVNGFGIQAQGFDTIKDAINAYYEKDVIE